MDLSKVLEQLRRELAHLDAAILSLERLQAKMEQRGHPRSAATALLKAPPKPQRTGRLRARRDHVIE